MVSSSSCFVTTYLRAKQRKAMRGTRHAPARLWARTVKWRFPHRRKSRKNPSRPSLRKPPNLAGAGGPGSNPS